MISTGYDKVHTVDSVTSSLTGKAPLKSGSSHKLVLNEVINENNLKFGTSLLPSTYDCFESAVTHLKTCASNANLIIHDVPEDGNCFVCTGPYYISLNLGK